MIKRILLLAVLLILSTLAVRWFVLEFIISDETKIRWIIEDATENLAERNLLGLFSDFSSSFKDDSGLDLPTLQALTYRFLGRVSSVEATADVRRIQVEDDRAEVEIEAFVIPTREGIRQPELFGARRGTNIFIVHFRVENGRWKVFRSNRPKS
jgi:hypothetical protein